MGAEKKQVIIPKEDAVFWMDEHGYWNNEHGRFGHPKISNHFHKSIRKDEGGYHVYQETDEVEEKVYFPHEDTALFVFTLQYDHGDRIFLVLNTGTALELDPTTLFIKNDQLYYEIPDHIIRFTEKALVKFSSFLEETDQGLCFSRGGKKVPIPEKD